MIDPSQIVSLLVLFLLADGVCLASFAVSGGQGAIGILSRWVGFAATAGIAVSALCLFIAMRTQPWG